jgi:hypothetical protein
MACVGFSCGLAQGYKGFRTFASSIQHGSIAQPLTHAFEFRFSIQISGSLGESRG